MAAEHTFRVVVASAFTFRVNRRRRWLILTYLKLNLKIIININIRNKLKVDVITTILKFNSSYNIFESPLIIYIL